MTLAKPITTREVIRDARNGLSWKNARLAREAGMVESVVRRYLNGQTDTSTANADAMMTALRRGEMEQA